MNKNKIITYSLLAHINNSRALVNGLLEIFIPIVKNALTGLNNKGIHSGKNISEVKKEVDNLYSLDIPIPVLKKILLKIANEVNTEGTTKLNIYQDGAFLIKEFTFVEFEDVVERKKQEIEEVEKLFKVFCSINNVKKNEYSSVFNFIERNKLSISKYLGGQDTRNNKQSFLIEAQFVDYFKRIPEIYSVIRNIYLGSIISTYIEFKTENYKSDVEIVFDTNFIVGLLDLNTPESSHTCSKLVEIARTLGCKLSVLNLTITEVVNLLKARAENFESAYIQRRVNPEDIYNACDRRKLSKTDLERFADNLELFLLEKGITLVPNTDKYQNIAKFSKEYSKLKAVRTSDFAALHDATALYYVREKRGRKIFSFEDVKCWFVHNSNNYQVDISNDFANGKPQPEFIQVDDLLNIFWLSNPGFNQQLSDTQLSDFGLNALISSTLSDALPKASLIRELDGNISKYINDNSLNEKDIIRVATRISNRELVEIEELNRIEKESSKDFIKRIKEESEKQKQIDEEKARKFEGLLHDFKTHGIKLKEQKELLERERLEIEKTHKQSIKEIEEKSGRNELLEKQLAEEKKKRLESENLNRKIKRDEFIKKRMSTWRLKSWFEFFGFLLVGFICIIYILKIGNWTLNGAILAYTNLQANIILSSLTSIILFVFTTITITTLYNKYRNHSNIKAFKESIEIPENIKDLKSIDELK